MNSSVFNEIFPLLHTGNPKLTLGLIWTIILHFQVSLALLSIAVDYKCSQYVTQPILKTTFLLYTLPDPQNVLISGGGR